MKKVLSLLLALVMCFSLCACGKDPDQVLQEKLLGTWYSEDTVNSSVKWYYTFYENGTCKNGFTLSGEELNILDEPLANYTIEDEKIYIQTGSIIGKITEDGALFLTDASGSVVFIHE